MSSIFSYPDDSKEDVLSDLEGATLEGGWTVSKRTTRKSFQSGSCFSVGYIAEREGQQAFMKAFDFFDALQKEDPIKALNELTETYLFERELLEVCGEAKMSKIVRAISHGTIKDARAPLGNIFYLLFEMADGDVRAQLVERNLSFAWRLQSLHHIATALQQLHRRGIHHQDLKPSNVLIFSSAESKLGDLGRAHYVNKPAPHDNAQFPGAFRYSSPELLYNAPMSDTIFQKSANDLYLFGSMMSFYVTGTPFTPMLLENLEEDYRPFVMYGNWRGFYADVMPHLIVAYEKAISIVRSSLRETGLTENFQRRYIDLLRYATEPDPFKRGHPTSRRQKFGNPYSLERFISEAAVLAKASFVKDENHA